MLNYLPTKFVVLFDVRDRRGWLVNGVNALYHILRSSLKEDEAQSAEHPGSLFVFKIDQVIEPQNASVASAAREFLDNKTNLSRPISLLSFVSKKDDGGDTIHDAEQYGLLAHRLEQFHDALEILFTYQAQAKASDQKCSRAIYERWDFVNVMRRREQTPRMMKLSPKGLASVDVLRSIQAVTLFGNRCGELISPAAGTCCAGWQTPPKSKYYIASSMSDIEKSIEEEGDWNSETPHPPLLSHTPSIMWHSPQTSVESCGCAVDGNASTRLVQVPWPRKYKNIRGHMQKPTQIPATGAIVLGYNELVPWHWPEFGGPQPGPPPDTESEDSDDDSGIGSSISATLPEESSSPMSIFERLHSHGRQVLTPALDQMNQTYGDTNMSGRYAMIGNTYQTIHNYHPGAADTFGDGERQTGIYAHPRNIRNLP